MLGVFEKELQIFSGELLLTFTFFLTEGSVGSNRGSIVDSEEEKEEEVRTWYDHVMVTGSLGCVEQARHVTCFRISELFL